MILVYNDEEASAFLKTSSSIVDASTILVGSLPSPVMMLAFRILV